MPAKRKREELERLKAEIQRRRKAMQELYLDKSSGTVSSAQFAQMNRAFLDEADRLEKRCVLLEDALARAANTPGAEKNAGALLQCSRGNKSVGP